MQIVYTVAQMPISEEAYWEIRAKMEECGYGAFISSVGELDVRGLTFVIEEE